MPIEFADKTRAPLIGKATCLAEYELLTRGQYDPDRIRYTSPPVFVKSEHEEDEDDFFITGFGSTPAIDELNEVVETEAFRKHLHRFKEFPVMLHMHDMFDLPIGEVREVEIQNAGLFVRSFVSASAPKIRTLIREKILKAFSIGFRGMVHEFNSEEGAKPAIIWKEIELIELSIVSFPANRDALFEQAREKGIDLSKMKKSSINISPPDKGRDAKKEKHDMEPEVLTKDEVGEIATKAADTVFTEFDGRYKKTLDERAKDIETEKAEWREKFALCQTKSETEELIKKVETKFMPVLMHLQRMEDKPDEGRREVIHTANQATKMAAMGVLSKGLASEFARHPLHMKHILNDPADLYDKGDDRFGITKAFQESSDCLLILISMAKAHFGTGFDVKSLQYWGVYKSVEAEFRKAMDTETATEGLEWIPTNFSNDLIKLIQQLGNLSQLFSHFPMPTKVFEWPIQTARAIAFLVAESLDDSSSAITASTPGTGKTTFTAKKLAARVLTSGEFIEDSIIAVLPFIREEIANQFVRAEEDAIYNGDTAATHMDADITDAQDHRKAWLGLRGYAIDNSHTTDTGTFALADLRTVRGDMGNFGVDPANLAYIFSPLIYITKFLADSDITTMEKAGARATWLAGERDSIDGARVRVSEFVSDLLNASGVQDGVTVDKSTFACVYMPGFKMGTRRNVTIKSEEILETDQMKTVGTMREDFQGMYGTDAVVALGINVS